MPYPKQIYTTLICESCGNSFKVPPSRLKRNPRFCCDDCFYKWLKGSEREPRIETNCLTCGKPMRIRKSRYDNEDRGRYCSQKCMMQVRPAPPKKERIKLICLNCGQIFYKLECQTHDNRGRFCCRGCVGAYVMKNIRSNGLTSIEKIIKDSLDNLGLEYESQYTGISPWIIDFAFPDHKLAIEADGKYWHSLENVKAKDKRKNKALKELGWSIMHLGEDEINQSPSTCIDRIIQFLDTHTQLHLF